MCELRDIRFDMWHRPSNIVLKKTFTFCRENVLDNIEKAAFNKPICEAMLNQKFFNGIGNYLRAEILYR